MSPHKDRSTSPAERIYRVFVEGHTDERWRTFPEAVAKAERESQTAVTVIIKKLMNTRSSFPVAEWKNGRRVKESGGHS